MENKLLILLQIDHPIETFIEDYNYDLNNVLSDIEGVFKSAYKIYSKTDLKVQLYRLRDRIVNSLIVNKSKYIEIYRVQLLNNILRISYSFTNNLIPRELIVEIK